MSSLNKYSNFQSECMKVFKCKHSITTINFVHFKTNIYWLSWVHRRHLWEKALSEFVMLSIGKKNTAKYQNILTWQIISLIAKHLVKLNDLIKLRSIFEVHDRDKFFKDLCIHNQRSKLLFHTTFMLTCYRVWLVETLKKALTFQSRNEYENCYRERRKKDMDRVWKRANYGNCN